MSERMDLETRRQEPSYYEEDEIDLIAVFQSIYQGRKTIYKSMIVCALLGIFIALVYPVSYTATATLIPEAPTSSMGKLGGLAGLAGMAGIDLSSMGGDGSTIAPELYPQVVISWPFQKALMNTKVDLEDVGHPITLFDYYTNWKKEQPSAKVKKYTIGLPGTLKKAIAGEQERVPNPNYSGPEIITKEQKTLRDILTGLVLVESDAKTGIITLSVDMPEAKASAQVASKALDLLQDYITDYKTGKARANLDFIKERYNERQEEFLAVQNKLAAFQDRNKYVTTATAKVKEKQLNDEYTMAYNIYQELAKQLETAEISVKEKMPNFTVLEPVSVPVEKSAPKRGLIVVISVLLGCFIGVGILFIEYLRKSFSESHL